MAKLKYKPFTLNAIYVMSIVFGIMCVGGIIFTLLSYINGGLYTETAIMCFISGAVGYVTVSGLWYIVKAACIYIEKEESEDKEQ